MSSQGPPLLFMAFFLIIWGVAIVVGLASTVFWIIQIVDVARRQFKDDTTKVLWVVVVVAGHLIGSIVYHIVGKPMGWMPGERPLS